MAKPDDLTLAQVRDLKGDLEEDLQRAIGDLLKRFQEETGLRISSVNVKLVAFEEVGVWPPTYLVGNVDVELGFLDL